MNIINAISEIGKDISELSRNNSSNAAIATPIGGYITALDNPSYFTSDGAEYLENGNIIPYEDKYIGSIETSPKLAVYGNVDKVCGSIVAALETATVYGREVFFKSNGQPNGAPTTMYLFNAGNTYPLKFSSNLKLWSQGSAGSGSMNISGGGNPGLKAFNSNGEVIVVGFGTILGSMYISPGLSPNFIQKLNASTVFSGVIQVIENFNNKLIAGSSLSNTVNCLYYKNANDDLSTAWNNISVNMNITTLNSIAYGNNTYVFTGTPTAAASGGIAVCDSDFQNWVAIPTPDKLTLGPSSCVFTGQYFICMVNGAIYRSFDGKVWNIVANPVTTMFSNNYLRTNNSSNNVNNTCKGELFTNSDGLVGYYLMNQTTGIKRTAIRYSLDHGDTWKISQIFPTGSLDNTSGFACFTGSKLLVSNSNISNIVDLGPNPFINPPDFIGLPIAVANGEYVRIL